METQVGWALIVDSDPEARAVCLSVLGELGFAIEICEHGAKLAPALARRAFDLILLNPHTPGTNGIEALMQISRQPNRPVLIALSGDTARPSPAEPPLPGELIRPTDAATLQSAIAAALSERAESTSQLARLPLSGGRPLGDIDMAQLYRQIAQLTMVMLRADRLSLMLWSDGSDRVTVAATAGASFRMPGDTSAPLDDSVSGWVIRHGEPLLIEPDGDLPFDLQGMWHDDLWYSGMCVPLVVRGRILGVLGATRRYGRAPFTADDLDRMLLSASEVALVIDSIQAQHQTQRQLQFLARLNSLSGLLVGSLDADQVLQVVLEHLCSALPGAWGYLFLRDEQSPWFDSLIRVGKPAPRPPDPDELRDEPGLAGLVLADGAPRLRHQVTAATDLTTWEKTLTAHDRQALLCVALKTERSVHGVIELANHPDAFDDDVLQFVVASAGLAAPALERARRYADTERVVSHYHTLFVHAADAIFLIDQSTMMIVEANPAAERMSGYSAAELSIITPARLIAPGGPRRSNAPVADLLAGALPEYEGYIRTRSGYSVPVSIGATALAIDKRRHLLLIVRNATEQQQQANRQAQSEKLAGMARLTAAIAHQINNPLQALHNTLHLLLNRSFTEEKRARLLSMAQMEVDRLTDLVRRMLELHRPAHEDMRPVSVHALLENALTAAASDIQQHHVLIERDWSDHLPWVIGIGGHLRQVFQDLATNAVEAMPEGGRLTVRTRLVGAESPAPRVLVEFADSGPGISDSEALLIFEPFYSTKRGNTGLGLAISYSIVERHGGVLSVTSGGEGTTFRVMLPAAMLPEAAAVGRSEG